MAFCFLMGWPNESSPCSHLGYLFLSGSWYVFHLTFSLCLNTHSGGEEK